MVPLPDALNRNMSSGPNPDYKDLVMPDSVALDTLPEWNLADLYGGIHDPAIDADLEAALHKAQGLAASAKGKMAELSGDELAAAVATYEEIIEAIYRAVSFSQLQFAGDMSNGDNARFSQTMRERSNDIFSEILFFTLELNKIDDARLEAQMAESDELARYKPWIDVERTMRPHQLSDEVEKLLHDKSVAGKSAWTRLFEETFADMRFAVAGDPDPQTLADTLNLLSDTDGAKRKAGAQALGQGFNGNIKLFTLITNTLAKEKEIEDNWRKFDRPVSARNLENQVEDEVVDALVSAVQSSYETLAHRYYKLKAKWFGVDIMDYWNRNAPLPDVPDRLFSWDEARETVLTSYGRFTPEIADIAGDFFDKRWIDAAPRPGKDSGAFSHSTVPSVHPYILMNFHGKSRDVMTLAHELGHGVHQVLSGPQGTLMADTPLTLAETASVFGEMLTFQGMLANEDDPARKRVLLAGKVEDMLNTVVRQIAFHEFETQVHAKRREGELSPEDLGDIWMDVQTRSLGPAFRFDDSYRTFWAYIPHFVHTPFYVYAYAFGDCLVNSLYSVFQDGHEGFQKKYLEMLKAGGTLRHKELLAPFGLDASDPAFWKRGLSVVEGFVDQLEEV